MKSITFFNLLTDLFFLLLHQIMPLQKKKTPVNKKGKQSKTTKDNKKAPQKTKAPSKRKITTANKSPSVITPTKTSIVDNPYGKVYILVFSTGKYIEFKSWKEAEDIKKALPTEAKAIGICVVDSSEDIDVQIKTFIKEENNKITVSKLPAVSKTRASNKSSAVKNNKKNDSDDDEFSMLKTSSKTVTENGTLVKTERSTYYDNIAPAGNDFIVQIFEIDPEMFPGMKVNFYPFTLDFRSNKTPTQPYWVHKAEYIVQAIQFEHHDIPKQHQQYTPFHHLFRNVTLRKESLGPNEKKTFTLKKSNYVLDYEVIVGYAPANWSQPKLEEAIAKFKSIMTSDESRTLYHAICQKNSRGELFVKNTEPTADYWSKLKESPNKVFRESSLDSTFLDEDIMKIVFDCFGVHARKDWSKEVEQFAYGNSIVTS
jgi:hypothetical protein